jgi:[ribosomal protein S5]-alanine N-acetyltransferase
MTAQLETSRLIGRPIAEGDVARLRILHNDERVMATLSATGKKLSRTETAGVLGKFLVAADDAGRGVWVFHTRNDGTFVGYCGARKYMEGGLNETELLYAVPWAEWKNGFATEMAAAVIAHMFKSSGLSEMVSFTLPTNAASRRVMEKCGFTFERDFKHAGLDHVLYRLTRTRWAGRGGQL